MSSGGIFDFSGFFKIQNDQLNKIKDDSSTGISTQLTDLQQNLDKMNTDLTRSNLTTQDLNKNVNNVNDILDRENTYLTDKKSAIDSELISQQRLIELNDSQRKKQSQYNYIILILVIALILFILLIKIKSLLPFIPDFIISFLIVILFFVSFIYIIYILYSISTRDHIYFDKILLQPPAEADPNAKQNAIKSGNLLKTFYNSNNCIGEECCSKDSLWNQYTNKCQKSCPYGEVDFNGTCIVRANCETGNNVICGNSCIPPSQTCYNLESMVNLEVNGKIKPFTPFEYNDYSNYM